MTVPNHHSPCARCGAAHTANYTIFGPAAWPVGFCGPCADIHRKLCAASGEHHDTLAAIDSTRRCYPPSSAAQPASEARQALNQALNDLTHNATTVLTGLLHSGPGQTGIEAASEQVNDPSAAQYLADWVNAYDAAIDAVDEISRILASLAPHIPTKP